ADDAGIHEVFMQVIDELGDPIIHPAGHAQEVEHREMLDELAEPDAACVWTDRDSELRRHQDDRQVLVDAAETAAVDLAEVDGFSLEELLENNPVLRVLAGGDANRTYTLPDCGVPGHVVRGGGRLGPEEIEVSRAEENTA